jgi:hypothetical protein
MIWKVFASFTVPPQYFSEETRKTALLNQCENKSIAVICEMQEAN